MRFFVRVDAIFRSDFLGKKGAMRFRCDVIAIPACTVSIIRIICNHIFTHFMRF